MLQMQESESGQAFYILELCSRDGQSVKQNNTIAYRSEDIHDMHDGIISKKMKSGSAS